MQCRLRSERGPWSGRALGDRLTLSRRERRGEGLGKRSTGARPPLGILGQRRVEHRVELARQVDHSSRGRRRGRLHVLMHERERALAAERRRTGEQLVRQHGERVEIALRRGRLAERQLGRHVDRRAHDHAGGGEPRRRLRRLGDAEIRQHRPIAETHQHVGGFHVAAPHARPVREVERVGELSNPRHDLRQGNRCAVHALAQRAAVQERHHQIRNAFVLAGVVHRQNVGMLEARDEARFAEETIRELRLRGVGGLDDLDRHGPAQTGIRRLEDLRHAAASEDRLETIATEGLAEGHGHRRLDRMSGRMSRRATDTGDAFSAAGGRRLRLVGIGETDAVAPGVLGNVERAIGFPRRAPAGRACASAAPPLRRNRSPAPGNRRTGTRRSRSARAFLGELQGAVEIGLRHRMANSSPPTRANTCSGRSSSPASVATCLSTKSPHRWP